MLAIGSSSAPRASRWPPRGWPPPSGPLRRCGLVGAAPAAAAHRQRPDDDDVERYHDDGPDRIMRQEQEVRDAADDGEHDADDPGPQHPEEQAHASGEDDRADDQVRPAPRVDAVAEG